MCTICQLTRSFDPARHSADWSFAQFSEGADAAAGLSTAYAMLGGDRFFGTISTEGDRDWVAVTLEEGKTYEIRLLGLGGGGGTLWDSYLRVYDSSGALLMVNDDGGPRFDSAVTMEIGTGEGGVYYFSAAGFDDAYTGTYTLDVNEGIDTPIPGGGPGTLDELAAFLTDGYWETEERRFFDTTANNEITVNLTALTVEGRQLARWALESWETVANLRFTEVTGTADIDFDDNEEGAFAWSDIGAGGRIITSYVNVDVNWISAYGSGIGSYSFSTYVHEIGHALGLGHQGDYNNSAIFPLGARFSNDSYQLSVMSYFSQVDNTVVNASYAEPISAMMADIVAIQELYGAPGSASPTAGDTVWGRGSTLGTYMDELFAGTANYTGDPVTYAIYDLDGTDLLDLSGSSSASRLDLRPEGISDVWGLIGNLTIARDTVIENARTGSGNDTVQGNDAANDLGTAGGDDQVFAGAGNDTVSGGAGADVLYGGADDDSLSGGNGTDTLGGGAGNDVLSGGGEADAIWGGAGNDSAYGGAGNDTLGGFRGDDSLEGGLGDDALWGSFDNDTLRGGDGNDTLGGADGNDSLFGDAGDDELWGAAGADEAYGGEGADRIGGGTENDHVSGGSGNDSLYGGLGNDTVLGGLGDDLIYGAAGNDSLDGGIGNDTIYAGAGNDTVVFADGLDELFFFSASADRLQLDDALWGGGLTAAQVVSSFGATQGADYVLDFGAGDAVILMGLGGVTGLESQIDIV